MSMEITKIEGDAIYEVEVFQDGKRKRKKVHDLEKIHLLVDGDPYEISFPELSESEKLRLADEFCKEVFGISPMMLQGKEII